MTTTTEARTAWSVRAEFAGPTATPHEPLAVLALSLGYDVASSAPGRVGASRFVDGCPDWHSATTMALESLRTMLGPEWTAVRVEAMVEAELDADLERPVIPALCGVTEAAEILGVSKQRVSVMAKSAGFPPAVTTLNGAPVWLVSAVQAFATKPRKAGRPAKATVA